MREFCNHCGKPSSSLYNNDGQWVCRYCFHAPIIETCRLFEMGHENPVDPKGSTAHVRDIKARRIDPRTKEFFYYKPPKKYFFPK